MKSLVIARILFHDQGKIQGVSSVIVALMERCRQAMMDVDWIIATAVKDREFGRDAVVHDIRWSGVDGATGLPQAYFCRCYLQGHDRSFNLTHGERPRRTRYSR